MYDKGFRYRIILNRRKQEPGNALVSQVSGKFNSGQLRGRISILGIAVKVRKILLCYCFIALLILLNYLVGCRPQKKIRILNGLYGICRYFNIASLGNFYQLAGLQDSRAPTLLYY